MKKTKLLKDGLLGRMTAVLLLGALLLSGVTGCATVPDQEIDGVVYESASPTWPLSVEKAWYFNTEGVLYEKPNYSKYNLLSVVQPGDILYEDVGASGFLGHIAIVEGIYYSEEYNQYYIQIIEAMGYILGGLGSGDGICRSVLDDDRLDDFQGRIYRVTDATEEQKAAAIAFCVSQIGKNYSVMTGGHHLSADTAAWYCSELTWASYYLQGIDLEEDVGIWITPHEVRDSEGLTRIEVSEMETPSITTIAFSAEAVSLEWTAPSLVEEEEVQYQIYRAQEIDGEYQLLAQVGETTYTDATVEKNQVYYYRVAAVQDGVESNSGTSRGIVTGWGEPTVTACHTPSSSSVYLTWCRVGEALSYEIYRAEGDSEEFVKIAEISAADADAGFWDRGLTEQTGYLYQVVAVGTSGETAESQKVSVETQTVGTPVIYYSRVNSDTGLTIKWSNVSGASEYVIYRSTEEDGAFTYLGGTTQTSYADVGLTTGTTYYYKVYAYYKGTTGKASEVYGVTCSR